MKNEYYEAYRDNELVRQYVDKYCTIHNKQPLDALKDKLVRSYIDYLNGKDDSYVSIHTGGVYGC